MEDALASSLFINRVDPRGGICLSSENFFPFKIVILVGAMSSFFLVRWRKEKEWMKAVAAFLMFRSQLPENINLCDGLIEKHQFLR